jgi:hypothetical protein
MEVVAMAIHSSVQQRQSRFARCFEFSRLQEEWLAAAYALVVPGQRAGQCQQVPGRPTERAQCAPQADGVNHERKTG